MVAGAMSEPGTTVDGLNEVPTVMVKFYAYACSEFSSPSLDIDHMMLPI